MQGLWDILKIFILSILVLEALHPVQAGSRSMKDPRISKANEAMAQGKFAKIPSILNELIYSSEPSAEAIHIAAQAYLYRNDVDTACTLYDRIKDHLSNQEAIFAYGYCLLYTRKSQKAIAMLRRVDKTAECHEEAMFLAALGYVRQRKYEEARQTMATSQIKNAYLIRERNRVLTHINDMDSAVPKIFKIRKLPYSKVHPWVPLPEDKALPPESASEDSGSPFILSLDTDAKVSQQQQLYINGDDELQTEQRGKTGASIKVNLPIGSVPVLILGLDSSREYLSTQKVAQYGQESFNDKNDIWFSRLGAESGLGLNLGQSWYVEYTFDYSIKLVDPNADLSLLLSARDPGIYVMKNRIAAQYTIKQFQVSASAADGRHTGKKGEELQTDSQAEVSIAIGFDPVSVQTSSSLETTNQIETQYHELSNILVITGKSKPVAPQFTFSQVSSSNTGTVYEPLNDGDLFEAKGLALLEAASWLQFNAGAAYAQLNRMGLQETLGDGTIKRGNLTGHYTRILAGFDVTIDKYLALKYQYSNRKYSLEKLEPDSDVLEILAVGRRINQSLTLKASLDF